MKRVLSRHDKILRTAIEANGGWVFKTASDAFCAAFDTAMDGLKAAVSAQLAIRTESWDLPDPLQVRMALHTGEAEERDRDYYGPALNRIARLESIGHGGQTLISLVTAEFVRDMLPEDISLRDLGDYRLKDLTRPETVFQLIHPGLPSEFPPPLGRASKLLLHSQNRKYPQLSRGLKSSSAFYSAPRNVWGQI